jgi:hypothetical protein
LALPTLKLQSPANALAGFMNRPASSSNNSAMLEIITILLETFDQLSSNVAVLGIGDIATAKSLKDFDGHSAFGV